MKTEITKEKLSEYFHPTKNFERYTDNVVVDYAEIEINPAGILKLEQNLDRCGSKDGWTDKEWEEINNPYDDAYEHIVAYVHFETGTDNFNKLFIEVITAHDSVPLDVELLVNDEEKQNIIDAALSSLHKPENERDEYWGEEICPHCDYVNNFTVRERVTRITCKKCSN